MPKNTPSQYTDEYCHSPRRQAKRLSAPDKGWVDKHGRLYVALPATEIVQMIDRTSATVRNAVNALEEMGLVERQLTSHKTPDHIYVKLPSGENTK